MRRWILPALLLLASVGVTEAGSCDVSILRVISPRTFEPPGSIVAPLLQVTNAGPDTALFRSWVSITNPVTNEVYRESLDVVSLGPGADTTVEFPEFDVGPKQGYWLAVCSLHAPGDTRPENDTVSKTFTVMASI
ncbi:MAG: hypothetical protein JSU73_05010 [candidate division WOR-3 bacterium]|nr:MAG: hypothetical protein JSU73_05010 [candidate division WOR-3 bacterium]